jgi:DeoR family transcriptional regulator of aga operon
MTYEAAADRNDGLTGDGVVATSVAYDLPARYRTTPDDPRERIAVEAAARVQVGSVVAFNGGTTTSAVARHLARRPDLQEAGEEVVTIVTNALNIAAEMVLRPSVRTVVIGGVARSQSYELHGPFASRVLADLLLDELYLGVDALSAEGASCDHSGRAGSTPRWWPRHSGPPWSRQRPSSVVWRSRGSADSTGWTR